ncbi:unnamed protein product, partial [Didymodactylos carnosus]
MTNRQVEVLVGEARGLHNRNIQNTNNDTFVEVYVDKHCKQRTKVVNTIEYPTWNETLILNLPDLEKHHLLHVHVYSKDIVGKDSIGSATIDLKQIIGGAEFDQWVQLSGPLHLSTFGEVHLTIKYL